MAKQQFMKRAIELSIQNVQTGQGGPFGAVIVKDGKIIGEGFNCVTSKNDPTAHAEVEAIRNACKKLSNFDLSGAEIFTSCEPCPMCLSAIYWSRIEKIYFGNTKQDAAAIDFDDQFIYQELEKNLSERQVQATQFMANEAIEAFRLWKDSEKKILY